MDARWELILFSVIVLVVAFVVSKIFKLLVNRFMKKASIKMKLDPTNYNFFKNAIDFVVYLTAVIIIFRNIPALRTYGNSLLTGAGVLAAIIGFASQSAFSNIVSGIFLVLFKPFNVGDRIKVGLHYSGDVEDITLRHTVIRDFENRRIVIPNSVINNETIIDSTNPNENLCVFLEMSVSFSTDINTAMRVMQEEAMLHPLCIDNRTKQELTKGEPRVTVRLISFTESGMLLRAYVWAQDPVDAFVLKCDLHKSIKERFDKEGIEIPYPYRTLIVKEGDKKLL